MISIFRSRTAISVITAICLTYLLVSLIYSKPDVVKNLISTEKHEQEGSNKVSSAADEPEPSPPLETEKSEALGSSQPSRADPSGLEWFSELRDSPDVRFPLRYARRDIKVRSVTRGEHASLIKVDQPLLSDFQDIVSFDDIKFVADDSLATLTLEIPVTPKPDASHVLLGSASTVERIDASIPFFERWLANTGARLIVVVFGPDDTPADPNAMSDLEARMRGLGIDITLIQPLSDHDSFIVHYFSLVKILHERRNEKTRWLGFLDDDTFIVSMTYLVERLATFDHNKRYYLGMLSEEWWTVIRYGLVAMGGGGIFLSLPMAEIIIANFEDCKEHTKGIGGDNMIAECVENHSDIRLTQVDGLYQIDLHGDRSGVFESGRIILSLHHWKEGYWSEDGEGMDGIRHPRWFPMDKMALVQDVCGDTCFLQRILFGEDTILTNGYSIASYPTGALSSLSVGNISELPDGNLTSLDYMERTWASAGPVEDSRNDGYDHYLCPCRPALELEVEKIHWRLMEARPDGEGGVRQYFRRLGRDGRTDEWVELHFTREKPG